MSFARLLPLIFPFLLGAPAAQSAGTALPPARNLQADADQAKRDRLPIVLFFRSVTCPYCRQVEELYLPSLLEDNVRSPRFIFRTVEIDSSQPVTGFRGESTDMRGLARTHGVRMVPNLQFLGPDGERLAPDLIGLNPPDFYAGYLDGAIQQAFDRMRQTSR